MKRTLGWVLAVVTAGAALADGAIRLAMTPLVHAGEASIEANLWIENTGSEPARGLEVEARLGGEVQANGPVDLAPGAAFEAEYAWETAALRPGLHHVEIRVRYRDGNGYPHDTVALAPVRVGPPADPPPLTAILAPLDMRATGLLRARLRWAGAEPRPARVRFILPAALACEGPEREVTLYPDAPLTIEAAVSNRTARAGSVFPVYVTVEWEENGRAAAVWARAPATIKSGRRLDDFSWTPVAWLAAFILATVFAVLQFGGKGRARHGG